MDHQAFAQLLGNYGEFVGAIAVVATLIYLASQIRQNTKALRSSTYEAYANSGTAINDYMGRHAEEISAVLGDLDSLIDRVREGLSPTVQEVVFISYAHRMFNLMETTFLHHREGSLRDDVFKARVSGFGAVMRTQPGLLVIWDEAGGKELGYTPEFREFMQNDIIVSEGTNHLAKA
jgi:small basic protein